ncbi:hypothetical protein [Flavobacterium branchiicola]|uniref:Uncharacterized protein n=1 Tax=Flavobacterium branchiicola TaxID=1114875 RepID=A0ABV9PE34_9FLAO|nr:hypothetical protein [Flavobacterium branchiicola]MBS7254296.1 hypothetical protein [Flavobacterium branchiicola]
MNKMVRIGAVVLVMMATQFINAQQNQKSNEFSNVSKESHRKLDEKTAIVDEELKETELKKTASGRSVADQKNADDYIAQLKTERQALEGKKRKLAELENNLNATNAKVSKLMAEQDAEYKKNGSTDNEAVLKQRAAAKENLNDAMQLQFKQQAEIEQIAK